MANVAFCYRNHHEKMTFTNYSQLRSPYMTSCRQLALNPTIRVSKTRVTKKLIDNFLFCGMANVAFCYPNHHEKIPFTKYSQLRSPYMTSCREFALNPTIRVSETKVAQKLIDNFLF